MRISQKTMTQVNKAAKRASVGSPISCEVASRCGCETPLPDGRDTMVNLLDIDAGTTDLYDKYRVGGIDVEDSVVKPGAAIIEVWTYERDGELADTVYVGLVGREVVAAHCSFRKVKNVVMGVEPLKLEGPWMGGDR